MSSVVSEPLAGWDSVRSALGDIRSSYGEFEQFFATIFGELETVWTDMVGRSKSCQAEHQQAERELQLRAEQLERERAALHAQQEAQATAQLLGSGEVEAKGLEVRQVLEEAQRQRQEMRALQEAVQTQLARLAAVAAELAEARSSPGPVAAPAVGDEQFRQVLGEIQRQRAELRGVQQLAEAQTDRLGAVAAELAETRSALAQRVASPLADEGPLKQLVEEVQRQRAELRSVEEATQTQMARLADVAAELSEARSALVHQATPRPTDDSQLKQILAEVQRQQIELHTVQESSQSQTERLAAIVAELAQARAELTAAREEIVARSEQLTAAALQTAPAPIDEQLQEQLREMEQRRTALEQERAVLERELEAVRVRAAEMAELLAEQKRQAVQQQSQWAEELKRIRSLVEGVSGRLSAREAAPSSPLSEPRAAVAAATTAPSPTGDPVLSSVMAQFQMLQKDVAKRRATSS